MTLINFTNHHSSTWSTEQLEAAKGFGEIIDIPFPAIDPVADETSILLLADEYVRQILDGRNAEETAVHIMGEFTLCYAVICRLQSLGVRCVASCTCRDVVYAADGTKQVRFHFSRFREYSK